MSIYQGLGKYLTEVDGKVVIVADLRELRVDWEDMPLIGYDKDHSIYWFFEEDLIEYLGPLVEPKPKPEELASLPACYQGLGWYYCANGALVKAICDLREQVPYSREYPIVVVDSGAVRTYKINGEFRPRRLVYYVGPDKPEQETYAEYYAVN